MLNSSPLSVLVNQNNMSVKRNTILNKSSKLTPDNKTPSTITTPSSSIITPSQNKNYIQTAIEPKIKSILKDTNSFTVSTSPSSSSIINSNSQSSSLQPINSITDDQIFDIAISAPNKFMGHSFDPFLYGNPREVEPTGIEYIEIPAYQLYAPNNSNYKLYVATDDGMGRRLTDKLRIAYSKWYIGTQWQVPGGKKPSNQTGPYVLVNHGVPANQTQWYDVIRMLTLVGYRVVVFDMLCMGWSDKPLFQNPEEKKEKLRWDYDVPYVKALADHVFGKNTPFVYLADDWGTGIMYKFMELYSDRLLWAGDQDGIRGGAYPVPEIEDIGQASFLPMDERPDVLAGKIPPGAGSFQMAMGGANQGITQILKTMAHQSKNKYDQWGMRDTLRPFFSVDYERTYLDPRGPSTPYSMPHKVFALKSMADRAGTALRSLDLMPYHSTKNPRGIKFTKIRTNFFLWSGEHDKMMSRNQRLRYPYWMPNSRVFTALVPRADHFSGVDQPKWIAEQIVAFHQLIYPPGRTGSLPGGFLGFQGIMKGNEREESPGYRKLYQ